ncbi:phosphoserine phosphatase [Devosia insulae DS-56]|uniref:Phosphoserine phosphatase n=1 Tax=Devosia insulae DS-56 TaxID=1116389 RepID=A0A1E5XMA5_9HYPH|nr:HAD family hydrolase [Devosia insulae]OEO29634.1 phosphoserine phosphatase [Devosia insulae DS-56]
MQRDDLSPGGDHSAVSTTPLPSWSDGPAKAAILDFVQRVTTPGPDFLPRARRIATFDNDGTLWCEQPLQVQFYFGHQRLEALVRKDADLKQQQPYKAYLERDIAAIKQMGKQGLFEVGATAFAGNTEDEFDAEARSFLAGARHPKLGRRFIDLTYEPQVELLEYLRTNGFKTFIVTGGGIDLVRALAEDAYGIPPEQVVGSSVKTRFELRDGVGVLVKQAEIDSFDDREVKAHNIGLHIGRRPIFAFGNSDGDLAMLRYTLTGDGPRLGLLLHHDDAAREFAYDREFHLSPLAEALDHAAEYGITVVSMKNDWRTVFVPDATASAA